MWSEGRKESRGRGFGMRQKEPLSHKQRALPAVTGKRHARSNKHDWSLHAQILPGSSTFTARLSDLFETRLARCLSAVRHRRAANAACVRRQVVVPETSHSPSRGAAFPWHRSATLEPRTVIAVTATGQHALRPGAFATAGLLHRRLPGGSANPAFALPVSIHYRHVPVSHCQLFQPVPGRPLECIANGLLEDRRQLAMSWCASG